jgi:hypothetical protein
VEAQTSEWKHRDGILRQGQNPNSCLVAEHAQICEVPDVLKKWVKKWLYFRTKSIETKEPNQNQPRQAGLYQGAAGVSPEKTVLEPGLTVTI